MLTPTPLLLDDRHLLWTTIYAVMTRPFVLVFCLFGRVVSVCYTQVLSVVEVGSLLAKDIA